jgi:histidinol phosphatase-like enzyme
MQPYLDLASKHEYAVHVVHSEGVVLPNGDRATSVHHVPQAVVDSMKQRWQPFNPPSKKGITPAQIAQQMKGLKVPHSIIFDMDGTIKRPGGDRVFPESPKDFEIVPEFAEWAENFFGESEIFIASNQRGVEFERKTEDFLREEVERLLLHVQCFDIKVSKGCFATGKTRVLLVDENGFLDCQVEDSPAKPSAKMAEILLPRDDSGFPEGQVWIVGDAHTDERSEDWEFAQNIAKEYLVEDILYIPIEMLPLCWRLAVR